MLFKQQSNTFFLATLQSKADCKFGRRIYSYLYLLLNKPYNYLEALKALLPQYEGKVKCIYIVILTPILMSILSSENVVRLNFIIHIMFLALFEMRNYNALCGGAKWTI